MRHIGGAIYGSDAYFYLAYADQIRRNRHKIPEAPDFCFGGTEQGWAIPSLLPWLLSYFPTPVVVKRHSLISTVPKVLLVFVLSLFAGWLALERQQSVNAAAIASLAAGIIYTLSPLNWNGSRVNRTDFTASPRALSALICTCVAISACVWSSGTFALYATTLILTVLAVLTAKFAIQVCVFIVPVAALFACDVYLAMVPIFGILLAILLQPRQMTLSLIAQIKHLAFYSRKLRADSGILKTPFDGKVFRALLLAATQKDLNDAFSILRQDVVLRSLLLYPAHILLVLIVLLDQDSFQEIGRTSLRVLFFWFASFIVFLAIALRKFQFLGEPDRYLEYLGFFPPTILVSIWLIERAPGHAFAWSAWLLIAFWAFLVMVAFRLSPPPQQKPNEEMADLCRHIASNKEFERLVTIPMNISFQIAFLSGRPCMYPFPTDDSSRALIHRYPIPALDFNVFVRKFSATHVVVVRNVEERDEEVRQSTNGLSEVYSNSRFRVFRLTEPAFSAKRQCCV